MYAVSNVVIGRRGRLLATKRDSVLHRHDDTIVSRFQALRSLNHECEAWMAIASAILPEHGSGICLRSLPSPFFPHILRMKKNEVGMGDALGFT